MGNYLRNYNYISIQSHCISIRKIMVLFLLTLFIISCAAPVSVEKKETPQSLDKNKKNIPVFESIPTDVEYLYYGLSLLAATSEGSPNYDEAELAFETLLKEHPDSKWKDSTAALIKILRDMRDCREKEKVTRALQEKCVQEKTNRTAEIERLNKANNALNEKMQLEITKLMQENERLKKDIEQLKDLEIKLNKRERMLR